MITTASLMRPLPIRPVDGTPDAPATAPTTTPRAPRLMQPLMIAQPKPDAAELMDAIRDAAFKRMLDRLGVSDLGALSDPTA